MASVIISENWPDALDVRIRKYFADQYNEIDSLIAALFDIRDSDRATEFTSEAGGIGDFATWTGAIHKSDVREGYKGTFNMQQFSNSIDIEYWAYINDQHDVLVTRPKGLAIAARRSREKYRAGIWNDAFNSAVTGPDALSLCNSAHTTKGTGGNQSNTGTTALSPTELLVVRNAMLAFKDDNGEKIGMNPDTLHVAKGTTTEATAWEILNSGGQWNVSTNTANFFKGRYNLVTDDYQTDGNNWFLEDSVYRNQWLIWWERVPLQFFKDTQISNLIATFAGYMAYEKGWANWRWIYGENVAG